MEMPRGGRPRRPFTLLVASCLFACSAMPQACGREAPSPTVSAATKPVPRTAAEELPLDPFQRRAAIEKIYRLKPDRRFLQAVEAVQRFFVGSAPVATAVPEGEGWRIRLGPTDLGTLSDLPDFQQARALLDAFAKRLAREHPVGNQTAAAADASPGPFDWEPDAIALLREAQARWRNGERSPELARQACSALASLAFQTVDTLGVGDRLPAQALAMLAVTHALGAEAVREEALTAAALGYTAAAERAAKRLPERDALRLYLEHSSRLEAVARGGPVAARYLQLRALTRAVDREGEARWLESEMAGEQRRLPVLALRLHSRDGWRTPVAQEMPFDVLVAAAEHAGDPRVPQRTIEMSVKAAAPASREGQLLARASASIGRIESSAGGPFYDADVIQGYDRSLLYSALAQWSRTLLDEETSPHAAEELSRLLGDDSGAVARDFRRWLLVRIAAARPDTAAATSAPSAAPRKGLSRALEDLLFERQPVERPPGVRQQLLRGLSDLPSLGPVAPLQLFGELWRLDWADTAIPTVMRALAARMDSRVEHRIHYAFLVLNTLRDLQLEERLLKSVFRDARLSDQSSELWSAGRGWVLHDLMRSAEVLPYSLGLDLTWAPRWQKQTLAQLDQQRDWARKPEPRVAKALAAQATAGNNRRRYEEAASAIGEWLVNDKGLQQGDLAILQATLLHAVYGEGRFAEAWQSMSRRFHTERREPGALEAIGAARSHWSLRDYDAAAQALARSRSPVSPEEWVLTLGKYFAEALGPLPVGESRKAIEALRKAGLGEGPCTALADALGNAGFPEQAFDILVALSDQVQPGSNSPTARTKPVLVLLAYVQLKRWKGEEAAVRWIRSGPLPEATHQSLSLIAYGRRALELLWSLLPEPPSGPFADDFCLLRAASLSLDPNVATAERRNAANEHYRSAGYGRSHELGKFLLGQVDEREVAKLATDPEKASEVSYYLGVKAEGEGRLRDATAWYRTAVEGGNVQWAEWRWSSAALGAIESRREVLWPPESRHAARKD